ncbi:MAG: DUF4910 domain-containing protein [Treponema sp.]|jgi:hypothetical protein|nr:DUF4910 domain-containing protein [Treponema sp.]
MEKRMEKRLEAFRDLIQGDRIKERAEGICGFHRIQASPGFRRAAEYCTADLEKAGVRTRIVSFAADGVHRSRVYRSLTEWDISGGACDVEGFGEIADYTKTANSVIVRSREADFRQRPLELVYLDKSSREADYEDTDLEGKLIFVRENFLDYSWAMEKRGALGVITDYVLHPETQGEVVRYTSLWWNEEAGEKKYFGFVLPPVMGEKLAVFCREKRSRGEKVWARGFVDARLYPGFMEVVDAFIPGETEEEILITAHLCHPRSSANDNASGVSAAMELMIVLREALNRGSLTLRRGVRLLLVPEMNGTIAYLTGLSEKEKKKILAALNLDMVGAKQEAGYGPLTLTGLHHGTPSFTEYAALAAFEEGVLGYWGNGDLEPVPEVNHHRSPFSAGSDHYILSDPSIGIPCTMLGQWPDRFYHTSGDTPDRLSPRMLAVSCAVGLGFALRMAALEQEDLAELFVRGRVAFVQELGRLQNALFTGGLEEAFRDSGLAHLVAVHEKALEDALRFFPGDDRTAALIRQGKTMLQWAAKSFGYEGKPFTPVYEDRRIPRRLYAFPVQDLSLSARPLGNQDAVTAYEQGLRKELKDGHSIEAMVQYYLDGRHTVGALLSFLAIDLGGLKERARQALVCYLELLEKNGLIEWIHEDQVPDRHGPPPPSI